MSSPAGAEAERSARMQSTLRLNLSIREGSANVYWKHDGGRFSTKSNGVFKPTDWRSLCSDSTLKLCSGSTYHLTLACSRPAKIRPNSGRWDVKEVDAEGREVQPQFQVQPSLQLEPTSQPAPVSLLPSPPPPSSYSTTPYHLLPQFPEFQPSLNEWLDDGSGDPSADPRVLKWVDATTDATRSTFTTSLVCCLPPTMAGRRQYLLIEAHMEDFGLVICPLQIKVYKPKDKNALSSFPLRFAQFDFREDSSSVGDLFAVNFYRY